MHPQAINDNAQRLLQAGEAQRAYELLSEATRRDPSQPVTWINLAAALRQLGRPHEEAAALERALALDPRNLRALLQKASLFEARGESREAAVAYRNALQMIPPGVELPPFLAPIVAHGRRRVEANNRELEAFVERRLAAVRAAHAGERTGRFDACLAMLLQKERIFRPQPTFLYFPQLAPIEFHGREDFPWLDALEAAWSDIRDEFLDVLADGAAEFEPYVKFRQGVPADPWRGLNHSRRWSVYYLWREGVPEPSHIARCPRTVAALRDWPRWDAKGPTVVFSVLDARTRIPPHTGVYNTRLTIHLPLVIPEGCGLRVGARVRGWEPGQAFVFDDTFEHEAWNDSDVPRAVLILDTWNPSLTPAERDLVRAMVAAVGEYYAGAQAAGIA